MTLRIVTALLLAFAALASAADETAQRSGFDFMAPQTQALQRDDTLNPGMLWVKEGEELWAQRSGVSYRPCASCHGDAVVTMRGVAARYPAYDAPERRAVDLGERIQICRQRNQWALPFGAESNQLLALQSFVAFQSRGMRIALPDDPRLDAARERGRQLYVKRIGQLNLACAQCHDGNAGQHLGGSLIPQAHANGYPTYRLEWQGLGSMQRRLRNCMTGVRAEPFPFAVPELVELELYLATRDRGMAIETPAVRP